MFSIFYQPDKGSLRYHDCHGRDCICEGVNTTACMTQEMYSCKFDVSAQLFLSSSN